GARSRPRRARAHRADVRARQGHPGPAAPGPRCGCPVAARAGDDHAFRHCADRGDHARQRPRSHATTGGMSMSETGIATLDGAASQVNVWLNEVAQAAHIDDKNEAYRLLRATLQALRDWLGVDEAADLGAQLPTLLRGIYYEGWNPSATPVHPRSKEDFVARVQHAFQADPLKNPDLAIHAVFTVLNRHVTPGQIAQVRHALQKPLRELWPED